MITQATVDVMLQNVGIGDRDRVFAEMRALWPAFYTCMPMNVAGTTRMFVGVGPLENWDNMVRTLNERYAIQIANMVESEYPAPLPADIVAIGPHAPEDPNWNLGRLLMLLHEADGCDTDVEWRVRSGRLDVRLSSVDTGTRTVDADFSAGMMSHLRGIELEVRANLLNDEYDIERELGDRIFDGLSSFPKAHPEQETRWFCY